jgi:ubiquinone/menaquinone biosynthesis C-methylase UbiE
MNDIKFFSALGIPAINFLYDFIMIISGLGYGFKKKIFDIAEINLNEKVVADIGCGTGTQLKVIMEMYFPTKVYAIEPDDSMLNRCRKNLNKSNKSIKYIGAVAEETTLQNSEIDVCVSTLMAHHLTTDKKKEMAKEIFRILKPGGHFILTDWGKLRFEFIKYLLVFEKQDLLKDNINGNLLIFLQDAGFVIKKHQKMKWSGIYTTVFMKPE